MYGYKRGHEKREKIRRNQVMLQKKRGKNRIDENLSKAIDYISIFYSIKVF